jgi:sterol desaturase/sphingolipid hydroxylase (fatty acid hydroxylase superfamily)
MPTKFGKLVKRHHMRHHFKDPDKDYGVSSPLWDLIFRTFSSDRDRTIPKAEAGAAG